MMSLYDTGVRPLIDAYLKTESEKVRDYGNYWSASSAGYCMRKVMFERMGVPPVNEDARKTRVFASGHVFHEWAQRITKNAGMSIAQEVELQDEELMIRGHFDDLILVPATNKPLDKTDYHPAPGEWTLPDPQQHLILYDYKTAHSKWFEYVKDRPMSHYNRLQLGTYMYMLRKDSAWQLNLMAKMAGDPKKITKEHIKATELTEARILKISKDDLRMHEQQLMWSPELEKEVYGYWSTLNGYWKSKKFPKCTCANYENGFMAKEKWNPYFYEGEPCSIEWYRKTLKEKSNDSN